MRSIKRGDRFRYRSKYGGDFYIGVVDSILYDPEVMDGLLSLRYSFLAENGVIYKSDEVEWLDVIRDGLLKDLGI